MIRKLGSVSCAAAVLVASLAGGAGFGQLVSNNDCATALPVGEGTFGGSTVSASTSAGPVVSCGTFVNDVWFSYTPSCTGVAIVSTCPQDGGSSGNWNSMIAVYSGPCAALTPIVCWVNSCGTGARVTLPVTTGVTVMVRLGGAVAYAYPSASGPFSLVIQCHPPPPNDECTGAIPIGEGLASSTTDLASTSVTPAPSCNSITYDLWYLYTPSCTGAAVASFCYPDGGSSTFTSEVVAYSGVCGALTEIACSPPSVPTVGGCGGRATFPVTAGVPVMLRVGSILGPNPYYQKGPFTLAVSCGVPPPNDTCATATPLSIGTNGPFTNAFATDGAPESSSCSLYPYPPATYSTGWSDVWFSWTATCGAMVLIDLCSSNWFGGGFVNVHQGCGGPMISCTRSSQCGYSYAKFYVVSGTTYYLRVASQYGGNTGTFNVDITCLWALGFGAPSGPGSIAMQSFDGTPFNPYFTAVTLAPAQSANFYGMYIPTSELLLEWNWPGGFPFRGILDASGRSPPFLIPVGVPSGLVVRAVSIDLDAATGQPLQATLVNWFTTP